MNFAWFPTPEKGMKALLEQITKYDVPRGLTLQQFVYKYAPPFENNSAQYLSQMEDCTGERRDMPIVYIDPGTLARCVAYKESNTIVSL
jgi:hypothetical protein